MKPIHQTLKKMNENFAVFFQPVDPVKAQQASVSLVKMGLPKIPKDYLDFLAETDGIAFNGLELYGIADHERNKGAFFHFSLIKSYETRLDHKILKDKLVIGSAPEVLIAYNAVEKKYELINRVDYRTLLKLPRFFDVLYYFAPEK